jgi:hypothetical protein
MERELIVHYKTVNNNNHCVQKKTFKYTVHMKYICKSNIRIRIVQDSHVKRLARLRYFNVLTGN